MCSLSIDIVYATVHSAKRLEFHTVEIDLDCMQRLAHPGKQNLNNILLIFGYIQMIILTQCTLLSQELLIALPFVL